MTRASLEWLLQLLSLICCLAALVSTVRFRLYRAYPSFASYLVIPLLLQIVTVYYGTCSRELCLVFPVLEPLRMAGYLLITRELVSKILVAASDRKVSRVPAMRIAAIAALGIVLAVSASTSRVFHGLILSIVRFERGITFSLGVIVIALLWFSRRRLLSLPQNVKVLGSFLAVWLLGDSLMMMSASFLPAGFAFVVNDGLAIFEISSYLGWALLLSTEDEANELSRATLPARA